MPPRFVRRLRNNMAQSLVLFVKLGVRFARRRCGSCSVFEIAQPVYKYAPNGLSDKAPPSIIINYSLLIINSDERLAEQNLALLSTIRIRACCRCLRADHCNRVRVSRPYSSTKPTILRNCGLSSYPCSN